jgi:hypothetical protein
MRNDMENKYSVGGTILSGMIGAYIGYKYAESNKGKKKGRKLFSNGGGVKHSYEIEQEGDEFIVEFYKSDGTLDWGRGGFSSREEAEKYALENRRYSEGGEVGMSKESQANSRYLNSISSEEKSEILKNIAYNYGISISDAEEEVTEYVEEYLYEFIADDASLRMKVYTEMKRSGEYAEGGEVSEYWQPITDSLIYDGVHSYSMDDIDDEETLLEGQVWIKFKSKPKGVTNLPYEVKRAIESDFEYYGYSNTEYRISVDLTEGSWFDYYIQFRNLTYQELEDLLVKLPEQVAESLEEQEIEGYGELGFNTYGNPINVDVSSDNESEEEEDEEDEEDEENDDEYAYYEVYDEETGKSLMIYAYDQEDAETIAENLSFEYFEDGDEYNPNEDDYAMGGEVEDIQFAVVIKKDDKNYNKIGYSKLTEFITDKQGNEFDKLYFEGKKLPTKYNANDLNYSVRELDTFTSATGDRKFILLKELTDDNRIYYYILHFDDKKVYAESYDMNFIKSELKRLSNGKNFYAKAGVNFAEGGGISDVVVYDNGGESFDRYTIFTPDGSVFGMSDNALMPNGFNMYIGDDTEIQKGSHLGKKLKSVPQSIKIAVERRMNEEYAKGGQVSKPKRGLSYGKKDDVYFDVVTLLNSKMQKPKGIFGQERVKVQTMSLDSLMEYLKYYEIRPQFEVDLPTELFTKESFYQYNTEDSKFRFVSGKINRLGKEELLKKLIDSYITENRRQPNANMLAKFERLESVKDAPQKTTLVQRINSKQLLAKGGGIGFKDLSAKVAKRYEGKKVSPKYQSQYGTSYSKSEAKEVGDKVAGKVYWNQQGRKMAKGGMLEHGLREGDIILGKRSEYSKDIEIADKNNKYAIVDLQKGKRWMTLGDVKNEYLPQFGENRYVGKTNSQVWNGWSENQRKHFLDDHRVLMNDTLHIRASKYRYNELPNDLLVPIERELKEHIESPSYAKGGGVSSGNAKIRIDDIDVNVYEDSYEEGEGSLINSYSNKEYKGELVSPHQLIALLHDEIYTSNDPNDYAILDGAIFTSQLVDIDGSKASKSEIERWKKGDLELFSENIRISVSIVYPTETTDEELSKLTGIGLYKKGGKVKMSRKYAKGGGISGLDDLVRG